MKNDDRKRFTITDFLLHLHPAKVERNSVKYSRTFGLGGINALLFFILALSGIILRFFYVPTIKDAYLSLSVLEKNTLFGSLLRGAHHWAATFLVIGVFLHLLRVVFATDIFKERKKNWYYGLALFTLVLSTVFAGYLLPWEQLSYWAVTVMTSTLEYIPVIGSPLANLIRGGAEINENTLINFYVLHTSVLPLLILLLTVLHIWLVRKAEGVALPESEKGEKIAVNPNLISKEILAALAVTAGVFFFVFFFGAPSGEMANPAVTPDPTKAPWYFSGVQELLVNVHPIFAVFVIPFLLFLFVLYLPKIEIDKNKIGVWFYSDVGKKASVYSSFFSASLSIALIFLFEYAVKSENAPSNSLVLTGVLPLLAYRLPFAAFLYFLRRKFSADSNELALAVFSAIISSYVVMGIFTFFLRGEGMRLIF